jgi:two-component system chemotaxis response regulator CheB
VRVLIADASPSVRAVLRRILESGDGLELAGEAIDGDETAARSVSLAPDAVVMDADLVVGDGRPAFEVVLARTSAPVILMATGRDRDRLVATFRSLSRGAVVVLPKPTVVQQWRELAATLGETLSHLEPRGPQDVAIDDPPVIGGDRVIRTVVVGASTGGPRALAQMLGELGPRCAAGVAVVQHIAPGFEPALVQWLTAETKLDVAVARDGEPLAPGCVRLAPATAHLTVERGRKLRVDRDGEPLDGHRPSIDLLFRSMAGSSARSTAAVLLSGMGHDGTRGLAELRAEGSLTIAQDRSSAVIWGMPGSAVERGAAEVVLDPAAIGRLLRQAAGGTES